MADIESQTIALAATLQSVAMVEQLAKHGTTTAGNARVLINSIFKTSPKSTIDVYNQVQDLELGLNMLVQMLEKLNTPNYSDSMRYTLSLLHLQKKLAGNNAMLSVIAQRIERCRAQLEHFDVMHDNILANLADIYADTLSTFAFRIQIRGSYDYLQQARIANHIRALLLAGVRSVTLWRQVGGSRINLILNRSKIITAADLLHQSVRNEK
ncbi:high frequency lysogenization protein HflD [Sessilibacter sp. MAH1]